MDQKKAEELEKEANELYTIIQQEPYTSLVKNIGYGKTQLFILLTEIIINHEGECVNILVPMISAREELCKRLRKQNIPFIEHPSTIDLCRLYQEYIKLPKEKKPPPKIIQTTLDNVAHYIIDTANLEPNNISDFKPMIELNHIQFTLCKQLKCEYFSHNIDDYDIVNNQYWGKDEFFYFDSNLCPHMVYLYVCNSMKKRPHVNVLTYQKVLETIKEGVKIDFRFQAKYTFIDEVDNVSKTKVKKCFSLTYLQDTNNEIEHILPYILTRINMGITNEFRIMEGILRRYTIENQPLEDLLDEDDLESMSIIFGVKGKYKRAFSRALIQSLIANVITSEQFKLILTWRSFVRSIIQYYDNSHRLRIVEYDNDKALIFEPRGRQPYSIISSIGGLTPSIPGPLKERINLGASKSLLDKIKNTYIYCYRSEPLVSKATIPLIMEALQSDHTIGATATPTLIDEDKPIKDTSMPIRCLYQIEVRPFSKRFETKDSKLYFNTDSLLKKLSKLLNKLPPSSVAIVTSKKSDKKYIEHLPFGKILTVNDIKTRGIRSYMLNEHGQPYRLILGVTQVPNSDSIAEILFESLESLVELYPWKYQGDNEQSYNDSFRVLSEIIAGNVIQATGRFYNPNIDVSVIILDNLSIFQFAGYEDIVYLKRGELTPATDILMDIAYPHFTKETILKRAKHLIQKQGPKGIAKSKVIQHVYRRKLYELNDPFYTIVEELENDPNIRVDKRQGGTRYYYQK